MDIFNVLTLVGGVFILVLGILVIVFSVECSSGG